MHMGTGETHVEMFNRVIIDAAIACSCTVMVRERPRLCTSSPALIGRSRYRIRVFVRRPAAHWKVSPATRAKKTSSRTTCTRRHASEAVTVAQVLSKQARGATAHGRDTCEEKASSPSIVTHCRDDRQGQHVRARSDHAKWMCRAHTSWIRTMSRTRTPPQRHASVRELNTQSRPVAKSLKRSQSQGCSQR